MVACLSMTLAARPPQGPSPSSETGDAPGEAPLAKPADQADAPSAPAARSPEMQLSQNDAGAGESERNENVPVTPVDFSLLKDQTIRVGPTATIIPQFLPDLMYFSSEYGVPPALGLHLPALTRRAPHGRLYESHSNSALGARAFFQVGGLKPAHDNQYGFLVEAPAWRGSYFLLETNQQKTRGMVNGNVLVPLPSERTALAADPVLRDYIQQVLDSYPDEIPNRTDIDRRMLNTNSPQRVDGQAWNTRFDQEISGRDRLMLQYRLVGRQVTAFQLVAGQNPDTTTYSNDGRVTWRRDWTPATSTSATAAFDRLTALLAPAKGYLGPGFMVGGLQALGPLADVPTYRAENQFRQGVQVRHVHGTHTLVFGFEVLRRQFNGYRSDSSRPLVSFAADSMHDAITNLRLGVPYSMVIAMGNLSAGFRSWDLSYYAGDTWRAGSNLTLSYGLRYQPSPAPNEVNHPHAIPYGCDCNNLAPQVGLAYRLPGAAGVWRMGYGLQYGPVLPSTYAWLRSNPPSNNVFMLQQPNLLDALREASGTALISGITPGRQFLTVLDSRLASPYSHQYNLSWERELRQSWRVQLGYVGSRAFKLVQMRTANRGVLVPGMTLTQDNVNDRRPDQRYSSIRTIGNTSRAWYDAAIASLSLPRWKGLHADASFWFGKSLDYAANFPDQGAMGGVDSQWEYERHKDLKGLSDFDQPRALRARVSYETGSSVSSRRWVRALAGGWGISAIGLLKSGTPFSVNTGSDAPGFGNVDGAQWDRPDVVDPRVLGRTIGNPDTSRLLLPASAFAFIQPGRTAGTLGRNVFRKGPIRNVNASLSRQFPVWKEKPLTIRAESINLFNTAQFAAPDFSRADSSFGAITNTLNNGRSLRLAASFEF